MNQMVCEECEPHRAVNDVQEPRLVTKNRRKRGTLG